MREHVPSILFALLVCGLAWVWFVRPVADVWRETRGAGIVRRLGSTVVFGVLLLLLVLGAIAVGRAWLD